MPRTTLVIEELLLSAHVPTVGGTRGGNTSCGNCNVGGGSDPRTGANGANYSRTSENEHAGGGDDNKDGENCQGGNTQLNGNRTFDDAGGSIVEHCGENKKRGTFQLSEDNSELRNSAEPISAFVRSDSTDLLGDSTTLRPTVDVMNSSLCNLYNYESVPDAELHPDFLNVFDFGIPIVGQTIAIIHQQEEADNNHVTIGAGVATKISDGEPSPSNYIVKNEPVPKKFSISTVTETECVGQGDALHELPSDAGCVLRNNLERTHSRSDPGNSVCDTRDSDSRNLSLSCSLVDSNKSSNASAMNLCYSELGDSNLHDECTLHVDCTIRIGDGCLSFERNNVPDLADNTFFGADDDGGKLNSDNGVCHEFCVDEISNSDDGGDSRSITTISSCSVDDDEGHNINDNESHDNDIVHRCYIGATGCKDPSVGVDNSFDCGDSNNTGMLSTYRAGDGATCDDLSLCTTSTGDNNSNCQSVSEDDIAIVGDDELVEVDVADILSVSEYIIRVQSKLSSSNGNILLQGNCYNVKNVKNLSILPEKENIDPDVDGLFNTINFSYSSSFPGSSRPGSSAARSEHILSNRRASNGTCSYPKFPDPDVRINPYFGDIPYQPLLTNSGIGVRPFSVKSIGSLFFSKTVSGLTLDNIDCVANNESTSTDRSPDSPEIAYESSDAIYCIGKSSGATSSIGSNDTSSISSIAPNSTSSLLSGLTGPSSLETGSKSSKVSLSAGKFTPATKVYRCYTQDFNNPKYVMRDVPLVGNKKATKQVDLRKCSLKEKNTDLPTIIKTNDADKADCIKNVRTSKTGAAKNIPFTDALDPANNVNAIMKIEPPGRVQPFGQVPLSCNSSMPVMDKLSWIPGVTALARTSVAVYIIAGALVERSVAKGRDWTMVRKPRDCEFVC